MVHNEHFYEGKDYAIKIPANYTEMKIVVGATEFLYNWMKSKGVDLKIVSTQSAVHESVPRITLWK